MFYCELVIQERTVTGSINANQLHKLSDAMRPRRAYVHILHDNARPHIGKETREKLEEPGWFPTLPISMLLPLLKIT